MTTKALTLLGVAFTLMLVNGGVSEAANPNSSSKEAPAVPPQPPPQPIKPKIETKLKIADVAAAVPGQSRDLEVTLFFVTPIPGLEPQTASGQPITFTLQQARGGPSIEPKVIGSASFAGNTATLHWTIPKLKGGNYTIKASYPGEISPSGTEVLPSSDSTVINVITSKPNPNNP